MKITGTPAAPVPLAGAPEPAEHATAAVAAGAQAPTATLQSDTLAPAREALRAMPDFDQARVAELRDALSRGELPFDAARLAGLIQRFHGKQR